MMEASRIPDVQPSQVKAFPRGKTYCGGKPNETDNGAIDVSATFGGNTDSLWRIEF